MSKEGFIDLHTHTSHSDGLLSPEALLRRGKSNNLTAISITDHDITAAYSPETYAYADRLKLELVPGIEISTEFNGRPYHFLGLLIDPANGGIQNFTKRMLESRKKYALDVCDKLDDLGWEVDTQALFNTSGTITKGTISRSVVNNPTNEARLLKEFGQMPTEGRYTEAFLIRGTPGFVARSDTVSPQESIDVIHNANGVAILAHPVSNILRGESYENVCQNSLDWKVDGIEALNVYFDEKDGNIELGQEYRDRFTEFAQAHNLIITGGSDFHHDDEELMGRFIDVGYFNYKDMKLPYSILDALRERKDQMYLKRLI